MLHRLCNIAYAKFNAKSWQYHFSTFILPKMSVSFEIILSISNSSIPTAAARAKYGSSNTLDEQPKWLS